MSDKPEDYAEFDVLVDGDWMAGASGPRDRAYAEACHYAKQYAEDGRVEVYEITRTERLVLVLERAA
jgi:hypothetical protein